MGRGGGWSVGRPGKRIGRGENSRGFFIFSGELRRTYVKYHESTAFHERRLGNTGKWAHWRDNRGRNFLAPPSFIFSLEIHSLKIRKINIARVSWKINLWEEKRGNETVTSSNEYFDVYQAYTIKVRSKIEMTEDSKDGGVSKGGL